MSRRDESPDELPHQGDKASLVNPSKDEPINETTRKSTRKQTLTEKGEHYQIDNLKRLYVSDCKKIHRQATLISELLDSNNVDIMNQ